MPDGWSTSKMAAVIAAASLPSGYAWLRWKNPHLWCDINNLRKTSASAKAMAKLIQSKMAVTDIVESHAKERPSHPCILYEDEMYTYAEVVWNTNRVARWVRGSDPTLRKGDAVCVMLHNGPVIWWALFGLLKLGVIASMLNYNLRGDALLHCIRVSEAKRIIVGSEFVEVIADIQPTLQEMGVGVWIINDARIPGLIPPEGMALMDITTVSGDHFPKISTLAHTDTAVYIFTSGTTGMPKPAIVTHSRLLLGCAGTSLMLDVSSEDTMYISLPLYHSAALYGCGLAYMGKGATIAIAKKFSASRFWDDVRKYKATMIQYIGEICRYLIAQPKKENDGQYPRPIKGAFGNGLQHDIWEEFQRRFKIGHIYEFYGSSEGVTGFFNLNGHIGSVGRYSWLHKKRLDLVEIVAFDYETGEPIRGRNGLCVLLPPGTPGLLLTSQAMRPFMGYKGLREMTEKKLIRNVKRVGDVYVNTGDLLKIDEDGHVYFIDRLGDTFRWKGENVSTQEVSFVLGKYPPILQANVYGVQVPGHGGKGGMAAVVLQSGATLDFHEFYEYIESSLPEYARPKFLRLMAELEVTGTYKLKKTDLVRRGFAPDETGEVYIVEPSQQTYVPITQEHIKTIMAGQSKL